MSVAIATMGMFIPAVGSGTVSGGSSGPIYITEEKKKPVLTILSVKTENTILSNFIEIKSVSMGD